MKHPKFTTTVPVSAEFARTFSDDDRRFIESELTADLLKSLTDRLDDEIINGPKPKPAGPELPYGEKQRREIIASNIDAGIFCPYCGKKTVLVEEGDGDFYQGPTHLCTSCDRDFRGPDG